MLAFMALFCGSNLAAVSNFGEFEFWFAALKIGAIALFLGLGVLAVLGVLPGTSSPAPPTWSTTAASCPTGWTACWSGCSPRSSRTAGWRR
ncbi:hypothetical protein GCM10020254_55110 [Streptomyces goshikiensis]